MKEIQKSIESLKTLSICKPAVRRAILLHANKDLLHALCEILLNFLSGSVDIDQKILRKVKRNKSFFRKIVNSKCSLSKKKYIFKQNGGAWMPYLLPPIIEVVRNILKI